MTSQKTIPPHEKVLVALATFNEIDNLPDLVEKIHLLLPNVNILIVDDNSPDGTGQWAQKAASNDKRIHTIIRTDKKGLGTAITKALSYAIEKKYCYVVNMDADFSHPIKDIPNLLERINQKNKEVDVVIGSRYVFGGTTCNWSIKRKIMSRCVNWLARITLGLSTKDNSGSFRCYRVSTLQRLDFHSFISNGYSFFEELLYRLKQVDATFAEIPIIFIDREKGVSKINRKEAIKAVWIMVRIGISRFFKK